MTAIANASLYVLSPQNPETDALYSDLPDHYLTTYFDDFDTFLAAIKTGHPQLILCHQDVLDGNQSIVLATIKTASPSSQILVIGPSRPIDIQISALKHGARGYFDSALSSAQLDSALQNVLHGEVWVERHVISGLIEELTHVPTVSETQKKAVESLSPKELEVAKLVSHGATNKMIAYKMNITERTVKAHLTTIFHKMNIPDRLSLAIFFRDLR